MTKMDTGSDKHNSAEPEPMQATISEAVADFADTLKRGNTKGIAERLRSLKISRFISTENRSAFIHLLCNSVVLSQARHAEIDFEAVLGNQISLLEDSDWFIPASLVLLELRYSNNSLHLVTDTEKRAVKEFYQLEIDGPIENFKYHRSGTTSIIFYLGSVAYKVVRPVYLLDEEVASLDRYFGSYDLAPRAPALHSGTRTSLAMEFVNGETLEEFLTAVGQDLSDEEKLMLISELGEIVGYIHRLDFPHGDLNLRNIIINNPRSPEREIKLIDYGYNYSLTKPVLSAQSYRESVRYIAASGNYSERNAYLDDLYAISVIILDIWFMERDVAAEELLHELSIKQPLLSFILEDCIVKDPSSRMEKLAGKGSPPGARAKHFSAAIKLACSKRVQESNGDSGMTLYKAMTTNTLSYFRLDAESENVTFVLDEDKNKRLQFFHRLSVSVTGLSVLSILLVGQRSFDATDDMFIRLRNWWANTGYSFTEINAGFWDILPGLTISLSFLLLAAKYYLNIFSSAAPETSKEFGGRLANFTMRLNSFAYVIPISYCYLLDPKSWPFCSVVGLWVVASNNAASFQMLARIRNHERFGNLAISRSASVSGDYDVFTGWGAMIMWYTLGISVTGLILVTSDSASNRVVDRALHGEVSYNVYEYLLAFSVFGINFFKMQRENCGTVAPPTRALILRYIEAAKTLSSNKAEK